jgi:ribosomal protein L19
MANLLDQASIVLTPTAYDDGKVLCAKPSEPPYGDFDFSRNSAATRVNAQGLVENVQILSSNLVQNGDFSEEGVQEVSNGSFSQEGVELVTNGDFSNGSTDWNLTRGNVINDKLVFNTTGQPSGSRSVFAIQNNVADLNKIYKVEFTISDYVSGQFRLRKPFITSDTFGNGTYTYYGTASEINFELQGRLDIEHNFSIDNVSVREVGQNWTLGTGWSIGEDKAVATSGSASKLQQSISGLSGKTCKVSFTLSDYGGSGLALLDFGSTSGQSITANGTYTEIGTYDQNYFQIFKDTNFTGSITNISVKEVGMDWSVTDADANNYVEFGDGTARLKFLNTSPITTLKTSFAMTTGKKYKLTVDVLSITSGSIKVSNAGINETFDTIGISTRIINPTSATTLNFYRATANVDLTLNSVALIEITDDTNLPRINYEGFSYQDALGSELLTNGDFATNINGWGGNTTKTWNNGTLVSVGVGAGNNTNFQSLNLTAGKTYRFTWEIASTDANASFVYLSTDGQITNSYVGAGTFTEDVTIVSNSIYVDFRFTGANTTTVFNSVSVKEYLGQEVVPDSGCGSWLFEPQSTNLIPYSEDFSQWTTSNSTEIANNAISPSGGMNAYKLYPNSSGNFRNLTTGGQISGLNTFSIFAKAGELQHLVLIDTGGSGAGIDFNLSTGVATDVSTSGFDSFDMVDYGNGWYRCTATATDGYSYWILSDNGGVSVTANGTDGLYTWGAQTEQQSYATSYIPTEGSTVTRNQDLCTNGGSLASINSTEGVLYAEIAALSDDGTYRILSLSNGTSVERIYMQYTNASNTISVVVKKGSVTQANISFALSDETEFSKIGFKYKENDFALWVNGVKVGTDTSGNTPIGLSELAFDSGTGGNNFFGKTKAVAVWKEALSDQELADLTYPTPTDPTFALDFDTIATDFTFARGSEATYVDAQGLIQSTASNDTPRIDYSTGSEAFLLEPQSTQLLPYSEDFSSGNWFEYGETSATIDASQSNPSGANGSYKIEGLSGLGRFGLSAITVAPSTKYTVSFYVKNINATLLKAFFTNSSVTTYTYTSEVNTSNWSRVSVNFTTGAATSMQIQFIRDLPIGESAYIWGAQLEQQDYATSYIPTSGSTVTRNQETCINATPEINSEEGVLYFEGRALTNASGTSLRSISLSDGTTQQRIFIRYSSAENQLTLYCIEGGNVRAVAGTNSYNLLEFNKIAISYKQNNFKFFVNGTKISEDNSGNTPTLLNKLSFNAGSGEPFYGNTKDVQVYTKALSDAELIKLTT